MSSDEERLRAAYELSSEWYWEQDADFRFTEIIGNAHVAAGLVFERFRGKTRWEVAPDALPADQWTAHRAALEAQQPFEITYPFKVADGAERWLEVRGLPRYDGNGRFAGYHGTARDVSARVQFEATLKKQATVLQTTLDHMNQGISVVDKDLRLIGYNQRFLELLDLPESLVGENATFEDFIRHNARRGEYGPGDVEELVRSRVELARRFLPHRIKRTRPDGTIIEIIGTPLPEGGFVSTYADITEQERSAERLRSELDFRQRMIDSVPGIFYLLDPSGHFLLWNRKFETVVGYTAEQIRQAHALDFFDDKDRAFMNERIARVFEQGEATAEVPLRTTHGMRPHFFTGLRVEVDGQPALVGIGIDISERKHAEEKLQRQSEVLRTTLEHLEQGISVIDVNLHMTAMNRRFSQVLDFPEEMAREGAPFEEFFRYNARRGEYGPGDVEKMVRERVEIARRFEPHHFKRRRPNGRIIEVRGTPITGGGFVTSYTDVTEQEQAQEALRLSEQRFRELVDMSSDWFWEQDAEFRFTLLSGHTIDEGGFRAADSVGKTRWELPTEGVSDAEWGAHRALLERHEPFYDFTYLFRVPNGDPHWFKISGRPIFAPDGSFVGYRGIGHDITEERQAQQLIRELNETLERRVRERTAELEASNQELESFSYSVSHDLRAPLRALHGFSHLLAEEYAQHLDEDGLNYARRIYAASERMGKLVDDLIELARIGQRELNRVDVDLEALAVEIAESLQEQVPQRKVVWSIAPGLRVKADPVLMKTLLDNLLRNAWKFTSERIEAKIEVGRLRKDDEDVYYVRDNGVGFDMAYAGKLFQAFQRLHDAKRFEGTGIGLAIVHRVLRRHDGRAWAESAPDQGATFYFTLRG
jgi:PAS domain S-box-containing protein